MKTELEPKRKGRKRRNGEGANKGKGEWEVREGGRWGGGKEGRKQAFNNWEGERHKKKEKGGGRSQRQGFSKSHKFITNHTLPFSRRVCLTQVHKCETFTRSFNKPFLALYKENKSNFVTY